MSEHEGRTHGAGGRDHLPARSHDRAGRRDQAGDVAGTAGVLLRLQHHAGNHAVASLLADAGQLSRAGRDVRSAAAADAPSGPGTQTAPRSAARPAVQRQPPSGGGQPAPASTPAPAGGAAPAQVLQSPHEEVNRRPVNAVDADLRARDQRYQRLIPRLQAGSEATQRDEQDWYANLGIAGGFIDWFNPANRTDPTRWTPVVSKWNEATQSFTDALAVTPNDPTTVNELGSRSQRAFNLFGEVAELDRRYRTEYQAYLQGFTHSAETVHTVAVVVRDVSFAAAVALAVVAAAPVVAGGIATFGSTTLGLGATGTTVFTYGGTALAMGGLGAGMEGAGQALGALGAQASAALADLIRGSERAADNFDLRVIGAEGWEGMKRGFVDGVLAFAGAEAEKVVASAASGALRQLLGPANSSLFAMMLRRAATRAISGGATGSVIGALQAGYRAAAAGQDLSGIVAAMEQGFVIGLGVGTVLGGVGGGVEGIQASLLQRRVAAALRERLASSGRPVQLADDVLVQGTLRRLRANPAAGSNQQVLDLTPRVWRALNDPDTLAAALAEVWLEQHLLGIMAPRSAAARFGAAAMSLSRRTGAPVVVLPRGTAFSPQQFFDLVVTRGNRFLDLSVLDVSPEHGAATHMVQDLAVDRALAGTGVTAHQFRALLGGAVDAEGAVIGNDLWIELFDSFQGGINQPEVVYPVLRDSLGSLQ
jgi:hypothetical protein